MFLQFITTMGNTILLPINRIKYIFCTVSDEGSYVIKIFTDDGSWEEYFDRDHDKMAARYDEIKKIVNGV